MLPRNNTSGWASSDRFELSATALSLSAVCGVCDDPTGARGLRSMAAGCKTSGPCRILLVAIFLSCLVMGCSTAQRTSADDTAPETPLFSFVHLTDIHCSVAPRPAVAPPAVAFLDIAGYKAYWTDRAGAAARLEHTVEYLNAAIRPDFVLVTGDLTSGGSLDDLRRVKEILGRLDMPYHTLMGDNDAPRRGADSNGEAYVRLFGTPDTFFDRGGWRVILLSGDPGEANLAWLEEVIESADGRPVILCTHLLVFADPLTAVLANFYGERATMTRGAKVEEILARHPNVALVLSGHVHCNLQWRRGGTTFYTTAALAGVPAAFRLFRVFRDRVEMHLYEADGIEKMASGEWRVTAVVTERR